MILLMWLGIFIFIVVYVIPALIYVEMVDKGSHRLWIKMLLTAYLFFLWPTLWLLRRSWVDWILFS